MYAIVEISGKQFKVQKGDYVKIPRQNAEVDAKLDFSNVLLVDKDGDVKVGTPYVKNAKVKAHVVENGRDRKIIVFKKKRRKDYKVKNGHRQGYTKILVDNVTLTKPKAKKPVEAAVKEETSEKE